MFTKHITIYRILSVDICQFKYKERQRNANKLINDTNFRDQNEKKKFVFTGCQMNIA